MNNATHVRHTCECRYILVWSKAQSCPKLINQEWAPHRSVACRVRVRRKKHNKKVLLNAWPSATYQYHLACSTREVKEGKYKCSLKCCYAACDIWQCVQMCLWFYSWRVEFLQYTLGAHVGLLIWTVLVQFLNPLRPPSRIACLHRGAWTGTGARNSNS